MRPDDRKYTKAHEWVLLDGDVALFGITDFAVEELCNGNEGDLVYCDLPEEGRTLEAGETFGEIESVKAVADLNAPIGGVVLETNEAIEEHLEILSTDPYKKGWMVKIKPNNKSLDGLMSAAEYEAFVAEKAH
ncbi:MAG: glycine cleavage system protein GcvH [Planctomycetota bacterium]|nr:glycine cleavage system protein GcvH [Planctomycetota bacterium]